MIRQPVASDKYYAANPAALREQLEHCLRAPAPAVAGPCTTAGAAAAGGRHLRGLIVPHGSLQDSGMVASVAYALLAAQEAGVRREAGRHHSSRRGGGGAAASAPRPLPILLLGTNHFTNLPLACLSSAASWRTPLGDAPLDAGLNAALGAGGLSTDDKPHNLEHSMENQLPFLQHTLGSSASSGGPPPFSIAPVCVGWLGTAAQADALARQLMSAMQQAAEAGGRQPLLIATTDFTHAGPAYREPPAAPWMSLREHCIFRDSPLLHAVCRGGAENFLQACDATGCSLCGRWPAATFLSVAEAQGWHIELLSYAPSDLYVQSGNINGFASFAAWGE